MRSPPRLARLIAALLALIAAATAARAGGDCTSPELPRPGDGSGWYCLNGSDTAVVFIHGLGSSSETAWLAEEPDGEGARPYWPQIVLEDPRLGAPSVYLASFFTRIDSGDHGFEAAAEDVYADLLQSFPGRPGPLEKRNILLVGHSLGGIIARQILAAHADAFHGKRVGLLLVASPSLGSRHASDLAGIVGLTGNRMAAELQWRSPPLLGLHERFKRLVERRAELLPGLVGAELLEQWALAPGFVRSTGLGNALYQTLGFRPVVEKTSAALYFVEDQVPIPGSDHLSIAKPRSRNDDQHRELVRLHRRMLKADQTCIAPERFSIELEMQRQRPLLLPAGFPEVEKAVLPAYELVRRDGAGLLQNALRIERDPASGVYRASLGSRRFACPGEEFLARLVRLPPQAELRSESVPPTTACFARAKVPPADPSTRLICEEGAVCFIDPKRNGLAEACRTASLSPQVPAAVPLQYWSAPSIARLAATSPEARPAFTEMHVRSRPLAGLGEADAMSFAVTVNGVPIHFDERPPHAERMAFSGSAGVDLHFALENLGFTGGTDGYEQIRMEMRFYKGEELIRTSEIARSYVSYRHARRQRVTDLNGTDSFEWLGYYRPARLEAGYEVMLTWGGHAHVKQWKTTIDRSGWMIDGNPVVAVIRPQRKDGVAAGLILGMRLASGQVASLFTAARGAELCRIVMQNEALPGFLRRSSHLFRFPAETFTDLRDRGERAGFCRDL